jgi:drug/metabolite transporter (DMT)-like permease
MKELMMNLTLWIVAGLLAVVYLISGGGKLIMPKEKIAALTPSARWVEDFSAGSVKAIGALEVLAAVGLILPAATGIAPVLVPLAAAGLVLIMVGAVITRLRRHEPKAMVADLAYLALAGFVAYGRFFVLPA